MAVNAQPMIGNLAWAPLPAFEEVDVLDRFNGVPTLGTFGRPGSKILFWRVLGYVPPSGLSVWLYVPLSQDWNLPVRVPSEDLVREMLDFLASSLKGLADEESVTPARRRAARKASRAVRELAVC
jgi:hypothetical protein